MGKEEIWKTVRIKAAKLVYLSNKLLSIINDPIEVITKSAAKSSDFPIDLTDYKEEIQKVLNQFQEEIEMANKGNKNALVAFVNKAIKMGYNITLEIDGNRNHIPHPNEDTLIYKIIFNTKRYIYSLSQAKYDIRMYSPKNLQKLYDKRVKYWSNKKPLPYSNLEHSLESMECMIQQDINFINGLIRVM